MANKFAVRKLIRNYDTGRMNVVFVDATTGEIITDLTGYQIIGAGTDQQLPQAEVTKEDAKVAEDAYSAGLTNDLFDKNGREDTPDFSGNKSGGSLSSLLSSLPFVGDFFKKDDTKSFPAAPSVAKSVVDNAVATPWSEEAGKSIAFSNPSSGTGPGGIYGPTGWVEDAAKSLTATGPFSDPATPASMIDLEDRAVPGRAVTQNLGPRRPDMATKTDITARIDQGVKQALGPEYSIQVTSAVTAKTGKYKDFGSARHKDARQAANDFAVIGPEGVVTDQGKLSTVRGTLAAMGMNLGIGGKKANGTLYMRDEVTHADIAPLAPNQPAKAFNPGIEAGVAPLGPRGGPVWGKALTPEEASKISYAQTFGVMPQEAYAMQNIKAPTPSFLSTVARAPEAEPSMAVAQNFAPPGPQATNMSRVTALDSAASTTGPASVARGIIDRALTPAEVAGLGYTTRSKAEKGLLSKTLAGELGPTTLAGIVSGNPTAIDEAKNIIGVAENRAGAKKADSLFSVVTPQAFDALKDDESKVTEANYSQYGKALDAFVESFYSGQLGMPSVGKATHHYNPEAVSKEPGWAKTATTMTEVGKHSFASDVMTADMSRVEYGLPMTDFGTLSARSFGSPANQGMSFADQYSAYGQGKSNSLGFTKSDVDVGPADYGMSSTSSFGAPANVGMSISDQYGGYGAGKSGVSTGQSTGPDFGGYVSVNDAGGFAGVGGWGGASGSTGGNANSPNAGGGYSGGESGGSSSGSSSSGPGGTSGSSTSNSTGGYSDGGGPGGFAGSSSSSSSGPGGTSGSSTSNSTGGYSDGGGPGGFGGWF
jgi:hypothetical protein